MSETQFQSLVLASCALLLLFSVFTVFMFTYLKKRNDRFHHDKASMQQEFALARVEESERMMNQISREIHDNIVQSLSALKIHIQRIEKLSVGQEQTNRIDSLKEIADQIIKDANSISHSLNSDFIKTTGLVNLLQNENERLCTPRNIDHSVTVTGDINEIQADKKLVIYRIAQDAIMNVVQHSGATILSVSLSIENDNLTMVISDNGNGIAKDRIHARYGVGLSNMRQRAKYLNGQLNIVSDPGKGCTVTLHANNINFTSAKLSM